MSRGNGVREGGVSRLAEPLGISGPRWYRPLADRRATQTDGQKLTFRETPESVSKIAVRAEALDGEQPELGLAIDSGRPLPQAQRVGPLA